MAKINWTAEAEFWLKDIYDFIALDNPDAAAIVISGIYKKSPPTTLQKLIIIHKSPIIEFGVASLH